MTRSSQKPSNTLLVRSSVGKAKPSVYDLPEPNHVYGKRNEDLKTSQAPSKQKGKQANAPVLGFDYVSMNRNAVRNEVITAKEVRIFRSAHPVRLLQVQSNSSLKQKPGSTPIQEKYLPKPGRRLRGYGPLPSDADVAFTYGKHSEVCTPVGELLTDKFQQAWINEQEKRCELARVADMERLKKKFSQVVLKSTQKPPKKLTLVDKDIKSLFHLSRFMSIPSKIICWRPDQDDKGLQKFTSSNPPKIIAGTSANTATHHSIMETKQASIKA